MTAVHAKSYGALPRDLGKIDLDPTEMLFWMYCPVKIPGKPLTIPPNLEQFQPIVKEAIEEFGLECMDIGGFAGLTRYARMHVYLTAKTLWVSGDNIGNRPGWHSDGFGTDDVNFIWSDRAPTEFIATDISLSTDCDQSLREMQTLGDHEAHWGNLVTYPDKHLLRLDQRVIHRSPVSFDPGMRTFVKVSISDKPYNLLGNSINHELPLSCEMHPRGETRNHPTRDYE